MRQGPSVSPVTGLPYPEDDRPAEREQREERARHRAAEFGGELESPVGQQVVDLIERRLQTRIAQMVTADVEASTLAGLLHELGRKRDQAAAAVGALIEKRNLRVPPRPAGT